MATRTNGQVAAAAAGAEGASRIGEIVEASTTRFRAVAPEAFAPPAFGSFVKAAGPDRVVYGVVAHVEHGAIDPQRRAVPLGRTWEELRREQPQVLELLQTSFDAVCVSYADAHHIYPYLPPVPPRVHEFVAACTAAEIRELTDDLTFVRTLAAVSSQLAGELVAAAIRTAADAREGDGRFLLRAGREVADLWRDDYEQACNVLRRLGLHAKGEGWDHTPPKAVSLRGESGR